LNNDFYIYNRDTSVQMCRLTDNAEFYILDGAESRLVGMGEFAQNLNRYAPDFLCPYKVEFAGNTVIRIAEMYTP